MYRSEWREESEVVISKALLEYEAQQLCLEEEFDMKKAFKYVSSKYPFGDRKNHPYKIWLSTIKQCKLLLKIYSIRELSLINWENAVYGIKNKEKRKVKENYEQQLLLF